MLYLLEVYALVAIAVFGALGGVFLVVFACEIKSMRQRSSEFTGMFPCPSRIPEVS